MRAGFTLAGLSQQVLALDTGGGVFSSFAQTLGLFSKALFKGSDLLKAVSGGTQRNPKLLPRQRSSDLAANGLDATAGSFVGQVGIAVRCSGRHDRVGCR